mgnify:CR=1 FL=1
MKRNIEKKQGLDITNAVNRLISDSKGTVSGDVTELSVDEAAQVQFLDSLVVTLNIDDKICSNYSKLVPSSGHVSDDYAKAIAGRMLLKAAGSRALGVKRDEIDVSDNELQSFYEEHDLGRFTFDELMSERAQVSLFGGQHEVVSIIRWRWNNGLLFMDYRDRVLHWINTHTVHEIDLEVNRIIGDALAFHQARDILNNDFEMLCESTVFANFNPLTKEVLTNVKNSRLTLDREALRALSKRKED